MNGGALDRESIRQRLRAQPPLVEGYVSLEAQLQPNGFDLTLAELAAFEGPDTSPGILTADDAGRRLAKTRPMPFEPDASRRLPPGCYLATFNEIVHLPLDLMALGKPRSSLLRSGVAVHNAVWGRRLPRPLPGAARRLPPPGIHRDQARTTGPARLLPPRPPPPPGLRRPLPGRGHGVRARLTKLGQPGLQSPPFRLSTE